MLLSVIISNRNDTSMLAVTVRSCLEEFKALRGDAEVVIVDNSDPDIYEVIRNGSVFAKRYMQEGRVRVYRQEDPCLFTARETAARQAKGRYISCLDGHMLVGHNMFRSLVDFMNSQRDNPKIGFAHAPISWCHQHESFSRHDRDVTNGELGPWGDAYPEARPITWKGMPWICRRNWFLNELGAYGALSEHKISWGGGDMHIGTKPWLLGYENWAVPASPGIHLGPWPKGAQGTIKHQYRLYTQSGNYPTSFGFLVACYVLGGEGMIERNIETINQRFGWKDNIHDYVKTAKELGQRERDWLLERQVMSYEDWLKLRPWERPVTDSGEDHGAI